nr:hypothetical protein [Comamonas testosteroni]
MIKFLSISIAALSLNVPAMADQPQLPEVQEIKRAAFASVLSDDITIEEPIRITADTYMVRLVVSGKKCTVNLRPSKRYPKSGRMEISNLQCDD